jgi:hypothetical protein
MYARFAVIVTLARPRIGAWLNRKFAIPAGLEYQTSISAPSVGIHPGNEGDREGDA